MIHMVDNLIIFKHVLYKNYTKLIIHIKIILFNSLFIKII